MDIVDYCRDFVSFTFGAPQLISGSVIVLLWLAFWLVVEWRGSWRELLYADHMDQGGRG